MTWCLHGTFDRVGVVDRHILGGSTMTVITDTDTADTVTADTDTDTDTVTADTDTDTVTAGTVRECHESGVDLPEGVT